MGSMCTVRMALHLEKHRFPCGHAETLHSGVDVITHNRTSHAAAASLFHSNVAPFRDVPPLDRHDFVTSCDTTVSHPAKPQHRLEAQHESTEKLYKKVRAASRSPGPLHPGRTARSPASDAPSCCCDVSNPKKSRSWPGRDARHRRRTRPTPSLDSRTPLALPPYPQRE